MPPASPRPLLLALVVVGCASRQAATPNVLDLAVGDPARRSRHAPLVLDAITDTRSDELLTVEAVAARLDGVPIVLIGESHTSADAHEAQERLITALAARGRRVVVGLEMYPHGAQPALDAWVAGHLSEDEFVRTSGWYEHWGYSWQLYRPIFLRAREMGIPLVGLNVPRPVISAVRRKGLEGLSPADRAQLPPRIDTTDAQHERLFRAFMGGDAHGSLPEDMFEGLFRAQCAWDGAMAWYALRALRNHPGERTIVVVLVGSGHVAYGLGIERQLALHHDGPVASVIPVPVRDERRAQVIVRASYAGFLWGVPPEGPPPPSLGISFQREGKPPHPVVSQVTPDGAAARAGVLAGDVVLSLDGVPLTGREEVPLLTMRKRWGDGVRLGIDRKGKRRDIVVPLRRSEKDLP